uniref:Uncharacterized protein n=1 Tax=mine drainage metagenome TaxID=410659 RepID=E6PYT0_9ZZZZ
MDFRRGQTVFPAQMHFAADKSTQGWAICQIVLELASKMSLFPREQWMPGFRRVEWSAERHRVFLLKRRLQFIRWLALPSWKGRLRT